MILVACAVPAERDAIADAVGVVADVAVGPLRALRARTGAGTVDVVATGPGPTAAAAVTGRVLAAGTYGAVLSAGVCGLTDPSAPLGAVVVADRVAYDGFGAESGDPASPFLPAPGIGLGPDEHAVDPDLVAAAAARAAARTGTVLTVTCATGTAATAAARHARWSPVAEAMEGFGVAACAAAWGLPFLEVRAGSNHVGARNRDAWDVPAACQALGRAVAAVLAAPLPPAVGPR